MAGILLAAAFPNINLTGSAWVAPALLLAAGYGLTARQRFSIGFAGGLAFQLATLHWLLYMPVRGLPILGWVSLSAYMALYTGVWVALVSGFIPRPNSAPTEAPPLVESISRMSWDGRLTWCLVGACLWVALEMIAARFLTGFPWTILGVSQAKLLPLVQIVSVTGIYGMSFLPVWTSLALLCAFVMLLRQPTQRWIWLAEIMVPLLIVGAIAAWGWNRIKHATESADTISAALIQPSIPQTMIWNPAENDTRFDRLIALSEEALTNKPDLLIWPEAAVPNLLRWDKKTYEAVTSLAASNHIWIILGADDAEPIKETSDPNDAHWFNSSFLIDPDGNIVANYRKQRLVIFGEYIPLYHWLPFVKYLTPIEEGFTPGPEPVEFDLPGLGVKTSVLICFEDVFPHLVRQHVTRDLDFLINLTNDGWFGESSAQYQQAANATYRAVENGVPLVRCTNNGLTCWIDRLGRMRQVFSSASGSVYAEGFLIVKVPGRMNESVGPTFYWQHGDWFGWGCVLVSVIAVGFTLRRRTLPGRA